nr:MAG TPA: hypothetical protein [Caudoviricetes sp.]
MVLIVLISFPNVTLTLSIFLVSTLFKLLILFIISFKFDIFLLL